MQRTTFSYLKDYEEVITHWYGDSFSQSNGSFINIGFYDVVEKGIFIKKVPFAEIAFHRIGQTYKGGKIASTPKERELERRSIIIPDLSIVEITKAFPDVKGLYYLHGEKEFMRQKMLTYRLGNVDLMIPAMELIHALFLHNKAMCDAILHPAGLNRYYQPLLSPETSTVELNFSKGFPQSLVNSNFAEYFAWLVTTPSILNSWKSIYSDLLLQRKGRTAGWGVQLGLIPPPIIDCKLNFRGIIHEDKMLVLEIESIGGLEYSFDELVFRHPSIKKVSNIIHGEGTGTARKAKGSAEIVVEVDGSPSGAQPEGILHTPKTFAIFKKRARIKKGYYDSYSSTRHNNQKTSNLGGEEKQREGGGTKIKTVSTGIRRAYANNKLKAVEFKGLEVCHELPENALSDFANAVKYMSAMAQGLEVSYSAVYLPKGSGFSLAGARRRVCGIVELKLEGKYPLFILEPERTGGNALKTIVLHPLRGKDRGDIENTLVGILRRVTAYSGRVLDDDIDRFSGSWSIVRLAHCRRHGNVINPNKDSLPKRWAKRLLGEAFRLWDA